MKRSIIVCVLALSLLSLMVVGFTRTASVATASPSTPTDQMLSAQYSSATLNPGVKVTLETLTFTVSSTAKLEVTSDNAVAPNTLYTCEIDLDGTALISQQLLSVGGSFQSDIDDLTVTDTSVSATSHTLTVACTNNSVNATSSDIGSVSAIVTTGL